jgi:hypothetical protein
LKCFQRSGSKPSDIPGCPKKGQKTGWDYCYKPSPIPKTMNNVGVDGCSSKNPCEACAGDCDNDSDCAPGLKCFQRSGSKPSDILGCPKTGQKSGWDYCYNPNWH